MIIHNSTRHNSTRGFGRVDTAYTGIDSDTSELRSASIHLLSPSTRAGRDQSNVRNRQMSPKPWMEMAELHTDIDGLPVLVRFLIKDMPAELQSNFSSKENEIRSLLSGTLETIVDRMRGPSLRNDVSSKPPFAKIGTGSGTESPARQPAPPNETVLRVGPLELDLLDRSAKREGRKIDLRPREFQLLKYMMQQSDHLLTRATLLKEVWRYKFVPETNLVDVHMGRLRRKVDASNELPLIRNVRGVGFILSATPCPLSSPSKPAQRSGNPGAADHLRKEPCHDHRNARPHFPGHTARNQREV
jgi:DNA-binding winged helix-turn-helix (wHTH) protein